MKRIAILGSTGSIGQSALAVVDAHPDRLRVVGLAAGENAERLAEQIGALPAARSWRWRPARRSIGCRQIGRRTPAIAGAGRDGLVAVASHPDVDLVLCASSGTDGLEAVLAAIEHGKTIALANKEVLVMAGGIVTEAARRRGVADSAGRQRAQRDSSVPARPRRRRGEAARADRVRRTVSRPTRVGTGGVSPPPTR